MSQDPKLPRDADFDAFTRAALGCLPLSWQGMVVHASWQAHNPDTLEEVLALFPPEERALVERQLEASVSDARSLSPDCAPGATVLAGRAFDREYDRSTHRTLFVLAPLLSSDARAGLLIVQVEEAKRGSAIATDHWVLMHQDSGHWKRVPIPPEIKARLYLDDTTGGA